MKLPKSPIRLMVQSIVSGSDKWGVSWDNCFGVKILQLRLGFWMLTFMCGQSTITTPPASLEY